MKASVTTELFSKLWNEEVARKGKDASMLWTFLRCYWDEIIWAECVLTVYIFFSLFGPSYIVSRLITYNSAAEPSIGYGLALVVGMFLSEFFRSLFVNQYWFLSVRVSTRFRSIIFSLVYSKAVRLRDLCGYSVGELVNICTNDGQRVYDAGGFSSFIYVAIMTTISVMIMTSFILSPAALLGCLVFLMMFPAQVWVILLLNFDLTAYLCIRPLSARRWVISVARLCDTPTPASA